MRMLITGSKGFIGSHLFRYLKPLDHEVFGLDKDECDINDLQKLKSIVKKTQPEIVFHLAARLPTDSKEEPERFFRNNVEGTFNLLESMKECGVHRMVYSSTMNVYGKTEYLPVDERHPARPINIYGLTKLLGERLCEFYAQNFNYKIIILRYSGVYGPGRDNGAIDSFISRALKNEVLEISSDGSDIWDAIYIDDAVTAIMLALENISKINFEIFNIGYGKGIKLLEIANKILKLTKSDSKLTIEDKAKPMKFYYDISKAKKSLKFIPTPVEKNLNNFIRYITLSKSECYENSKR